jgi:hypothetical protein
VEKFESEHPLLDRLVNLDWSAILKIVLALLPLFLATAPKAASVAEQVFGTDV